ncbi:imidazolonepropionase [Roseisalinus antarcticus]|uniref:Imidazolonepropionase n=1 Tax=Roseisalinus antarcticus TaxID=254357 RepID=A0A1Y5RDQ5_9RHOB|nr:imidazolonepropionase [Roseisalinus antarcticus]SLN15098.1 Imidazolonepropionase [Roseisalinus antarcticus]
MSDSKIWRNARLADAPPDGPGLVDIAVGGGRITAVGPALPREGAQEIDCEGRLVTPAFIDCHSHIIHGGDRTGEFERRLEGATYQEITRAGGGIAASVRATRAMDVDALIAASLPRIDALLAEGCSTLEIKSGYGLSIGAELTMLRAARRIATLRPLRVRTTWLAAHAMPPGETGSKADYIREVAIAGLEQAHAEGLVDAVDAFCEGIAFSADEIAPLFERAASLGLPVKLHTEQLTRSGGTQLAARHGALSVDHFEYATAEDVAAIRASGSVAVLLPGAFYMLRETQVPPVAALREAGVPMALATDANPGTSPLTSLLLAMNMGAVLFGMTVRECLDGVTCHAARALGLQAETGRIAPGLSADFTLWDAERPAELVGRLGLNPLRSHVHQGTVTDV